MALKFDCSSCGSSITSNFIKLGEILKCPHCGVEVTVPEDSDEIESSNVPFGGEDIKRIQPSSTKETSSSTPTPAARDYSTLMFIGKMNSVLGWIVVLGGVIAIFVGFGAPSQLAILTISFPGLFAAIIGLLVVASGQMISCFVSTERHSKETSEILGQHTEILRQIASNTETEKETINRNPDG
jgi:uncharacterized Zn finger protein (UPF0148 family)